MIVTAWILLIVFGLLSLIFLNKLIGGRINKAEATFMFLSIILTALSAGVIWGGLFQ